MANRRVDEKNQITKQEMAKRMHTSRSQLDRFLDPDNDRVLLETVQRGGFGRKKRVSMVLEDMPERA